MLIGIMSDTHDNLPKTNGALAVFQQRGVEAILHAGDYVAPFALKVLMQPGIRLIGVFGNNDGERAGLSRLCEELYEPPHRFELAGRTIVLAHDGEALAEDARAEADLLVFGHSHQAEVGRRAPLTVNPGEAGGWLHGRSTVALVELDHMEAEIIDLGPQETVPV